jgi:hypothetical protein
METSKNLNKLSKSIETLFSQKRPPILEEGKDSFLSMARDKKPTQHEKLLAPYYNLTRSQYNSLKADLSQLVNLEKHLEIGSVERAQSEKEVVRLQKQIDQIDARIKTLKNQCVNESVIGQILLFTLGLVLSFILMQSEYTLLAESFQLLTSTRANAVSMAMGAGVGLLLFSHILPILINRLVKSRAGRRVCRMIVGGVVSTALFYLAYIRADYLNQLNGTDISALPYFFLTFIPFVGMNLCASYLVLPQISSIQDYVSNTRKQAVIWINQIKANRLKRQIIRIEEEISERLKERLEEIVLAKNANYRIDTYYAQDIAEMLDINLRNRTDSIVPDCFSQGILPLDDPFSHIVI